MEKANQSKLCSQLLGVIEKKFFLKQGREFERVTRLLEQLFCAKRIYPWSSPVPIRKRKKLFHGEMATLNAFYNLPASTRLKTSECLFLSTHEPCSLCLSAITWTRFDNFYYLFGYEETKEAFQIPHDLKILQEVFKPPDGNYARQNMFWKSHDVRKLASIPSGIEGQRLDQ